MTTIRKNTDVKYIILHHSGQYSQSEGYNLNDSFNNKGLFGIPYDIVINTNGNIDLSPRWIYAAKETQYIMNVLIKDIFRQYKTHHPAGLDVMQYNLNSVHIVLMGNFDIKKPSIHQYNSLINILKEAVRYFDISLNTRLLYYSDIYNTTSPGALFYNKVRLYDNAV